MNHGFVFEPVNDEPEHGMIEETIASAALAMIMDWVTHAVNGPLLTNSGQ